ncbi:acyltransferase domain-containing protein [Ancylobacter sp. MQZ15Z-1]|uniref:Acyltransferase domain-containing protein n=1 Tax=Ancylobacter mangrovi TaxID=2972472 RepID=A0A9X2P890_9HYPH|nr:type I polyketide synthase [Ancylobacter mangrovi]MCS0494082.1 acyltransferase domain-containing protein [Ancylobacter mangrovi]
MLMQTAKPEDGSDGDIAIVGISCVFPGAEGPDAFFANILRGEEQVREPQPDWDAARYLAGAGPTRITTSAGGYLGDLFRFDPTEFGIMPSSVDGSEPDQFMALKAARAALADAGYLGEGHDHTNSGIILGHSTYLHRGNANVVQHGIVVDQMVSLIGSLLPEADGQALETLKAALVAKLPPFNADIAPGLVPNVMTGRIANKLDLRGPNYIIDAACASSLLAVNIAMEELRSGRSDLMLAGGVNAALPAEVYMVFTQLGALSKRGRVRPFSSGGDGTLLGEGLGMVALKRLEDARAAGDKIYAVVKAVGQSSDGRGSGLLAPRLEGEILAMRRALDISGVDPASIGLVEAHGTGIPLGDRTEITALREVFGARLEGLPRTALGSVKSMIGHCIPAAGMAGLIKAAMALHHKVLPPTLCDEVNPELGIETTRLYVNTAARPWVQPMGAKRRAAVNAFGFGGINSHAVLEEAPPSAAPPRPRALSAELVVLAGETPEALAGSVDALLAALDGPLAGASLAAIGAALAERAAGAGPARLAVVASTVEELKDRLAKARARVAAGKSTLNGRGNAFFSPAPVEGRLAFVFPGEGCQYQGMLAGVLTAFPEAREWFDFWDGLFGDARGFRPSDCIFPPPTTLDPAWGARLEEALFGLELGSESVFVASQAMLAVTRTVGLEPDAMLGHSSGEHSALRAAGVFGSEDWAGLEHNIRELNRLYKGMEGAGHAEGGALLTVGAVPRERMLALADGGGVHLALDNCRQQTVLYGDRARLEAIASELGREGGLCAFLPFDRPYHTPLFAPVAEMVEGTYRDMGFHAPRVPVYSCATAAPMPDEPVAIEALAAEQWRSRVRFTETIERMYADGFRTFIEVGPSANLTGFIDNILQGTQGETLAIALDSRRRAGLGQMLSAFGRIWASGRGLDIGALYARRGVVPADLDAARAPLQRERVLPNTLPMMRFAPDEISQLRQALLPTGPAEAPAAIGAPADLQPVADAVSAREGAEAVLMGHFALMQQFLDTQADVLRAAVAGAGWSAGEAEAQEGPAAYPFLQALIEDGPDRLVASCDVDALADTYVRDHVLYASTVSDLDPDLAALPVVPLAVSLEMLAEVASALDGRGEAPARLEKVRAHNWVALDEGWRRLVLTATLLPSSADERRFAASVAAEDGSPLVDAEVVFAPHAMAGEVAPLSAPRPPEWRDEDLYTTGMFHGPLYHSIDGLTAWNEHGLDARLADTPLEGFFRAGEWPGLLLNPVLLDAIGHVTAFWIAQGFGTDFSSFPSRIERIDLPGGGREDTGGGRIGGRMAFESGEGGARFLSGDFSAVDAEGRLLFRATGWRDRFFDVPHRFCRARWQPRDNFYGEDVTAAFSGPFPEGAIAWSVPAFPAGFLDDAGGIWRRVIAHTVLGAEERVEWAALPPNPRRRSDWLMGRIAIKESVRTYWAGLTGTLLLPADIVVRTLEDGRPVVSGEGLELFGAPPEVSVSHVDGEAFATVAPAGTGVGADLERRGRAGLADILAGGFSEAERAAIPPEMVPLAWCAKEAAAKALGTGFAHAPLSFTVRALAPGGAMVDGPGVAGIPVALAEQDGSIWAAAFL